LPISKGYTGQPWKRTQKNNRQSRKKALTVEFIDAFSSEYYILMSLFASG
jgi:hypothetical protein